MTKNERIKFKTGKTYKGCGFHGFINITKRGYINIYEYISESDQYFNRLYVGYTLTEAKKLFKKEFKEFKNKKMDA